MLVPRPVPTTWAAGNAALPVLWCVSLFPPCLFKPLSAPWCCRPCVSLSFPSIPQGVTDTQLRDGGSSAHHRGDAGGDPDSLECRPQPSFVLLLGTCGTRLYFMCIFLQGHPFFAFTSIPPFPAEAVFITSAGKLLTRV